jgi:hypothetical protein
VPSSCNAMAFLYGVKIPGSAPNKCEWL